MIDNLLLGFSIATSWINLLYCFGGVFIGTLVGVLPGLGPMAAISLLLPLVFAINDPITSIIFLSGVYYGTQYGGSTTAILLNLPGEVASSVTTIDGYQLTKKGRAGAALTVAAIGSFFAGTVATLLIASLAVPISKLGLLFGPAEYTMLMVLGLIAAIALSHGSMIKGLGMVLIGILMGIVGIDINSGEQRFVFDSMYLMDGFNFAIIAMGVFGLGELLYSMLHGTNSKITIPDLKSLYPTKKEWKRFVPSTLRGTTIGSFLGVLPGGGAIISAFAAYALEKYVAKDPSKLGKGAIEGVAGPESANNAGAQASFIPMLSLGLPTTPIMALLISALIMNDIQPGPQVIENNQNLFWGLVASMWIGNLLLLVLNLPLVRLWVQILKMPTRLLYPTVVAVCVFGAYSINGNWNDVFVLFIFGLLGYLFRCLKLEPAPLAMGFVIGALLEEYFRRAMNVYDGNFMIFLERPISLLFIILIVLLVVFKNVAKRNKLQ
jgi:TctA family transporter